MDYDGRYLWVPVTEYLPHSYSIIYKIDPLTMTATEVFDYDDSIGAIVCNTDDRTLVGMNWDARDFLSLDARRARDPSPMRTSHQKS